LWPVRTTIDPEAWLSNFRDGEEKFANRLLEGFVFYNESLVAQMFRGTFANISQYVADNKSGHLAASTEWARFLSSVRIVRVTGETPNDTDSGYIFARLAKTFLRFPERQVVGHEEALTQLIRNPRQPLVFVDDFVGSGSQFAETWRRQHRIGAGYYSFKSVTDASPSANTTFYAPIVCTELGQRTINLVAPNLRLIPAHLIGPQYSVLSPNSIVWRDLASEGPTFIQEASARAGIPDRNGEVGCWRGFNQLGLAIAFAHGCPDATIPLLTFDRNGWKPLIRMSPP
jgi:hypothetical protein